jgi:hypothetical protein
MLGESAKTYFHECAAWAERSPDHHFRRVIALSSQQGMTEWMKGEAERSEKLRAKDVNYRVKILPWELRAVDALSVAIIDSEYVFVAFSGEEDKLVGFSLKSHRMATEYFGPYYEKLWTAGEAATDVLRRQRDRQATGPENQSLDLRVTDVHAPSSPSSDEAG